MLGDERAVHPDAGANVTQRLDILEMPRSTGSLWKGSRQKERKGTSRGQRDEMRWRRQVNGKSITGMSGKSQRLLMGLSAIHRSPTPPLRFTALLPLTNRPWDTRRIASNRVLVCIVASVARPLHGRNSETCTFGSGTVNCTYWAKL